MDKILQSLNIRSNEKLLVLLMLGFSFCVGIATSFLKTIADASFIIHFGITKVPEAIVFGGILGYVINSLLTLLYKRLGFGNVTTLLTLATSIIITTFCAMLIFGSALGGSIYWLFIVSMPLTIIIENAFNGTILRYLNYEQNKRLSGLLIAGAVFSGIIGCFLIPFLKSVFPKKEYLLLFSALGCILSLFLFTLIKKKIQAHEESGGTQKAKPISLPTKSRYFWLMTVFVMISAGMFFVINFGFLYLLGDIKEKHSADLVLLLIAIMNGIIKLSEFTLTLISGKILARRGVVFGLSALPFVLLVCVVLAFIFTEAHQFWIFFGCIVMAKFVERVVRKGLLRPSLNVLYQLFDKKKSKVQHFLDGNIASFSAVFFGGLLWLMVIEVHDDLTIPFSFFTSIVVGGWFGLTILIAVQYRRELFKKLRSIAPTKKETVIDLLTTNQYEVGAIPVKGTLFTQLTRPLLLVDNVAVEVDDSKKKLTKAELKENLKMVVTFDKLSYLLATHYKMESNPFYNEMSQFFEQEIEDEIHQIGKDLSKKYNQRKIKNALKVIYHSPTDEEQLYAYELLTATIDKEDKKKLRTVYNLITSTSFEKTLFFNVIGKKIGLRNLMKSIIKEEQFAFSSILRSSAIHVLGQNYVLMVPKEIREAASSDEPLTSEMAKAVLIFDENEGSAPLATGEQWNTLNQIMLTKTLKGLGNSQLSELLKLAERAEKIDINSNDTYLILNGWIEIVFNGTSSLINMSDDLLAQQEVTNTTAEEAVILSWKTEDFVKTLLQN